MNSELLKRPKTAQSNKDSNAGEQWLAWLSVLVNDREWLGLFEFGPEPDVLLRRHGYPLAAAAPESALDQARKVRNAKRPIISQVSSVDSHPDSSSESSKSGAENYSLMALPLNDSASRVLVTLGSVQKPEQQAALFRLARWAAERLEENPEDTVNSGESNESAVDLGTLPSAVLQASYQYSTAHAMALSIVNTVKRLCGCSRVTLAILAPSRPIKSTQIIAMSDQAQIDTRKVLPAQINAAMQEQLLDNSIGGLSAENVSEHTNRYPSTVTLFIEQGENPSLGVVYPEIDAREKQLLMNGESAKSHIVVLLERPANQNFSDAQERAIQSLLEPSLDLVVRRLDEQKRLRSRLKSRLKEKLHHSYLVEKGLKKPSLTFAALAAIATLFIPIEHRFTATAAIEAKDLQVLVAPQNGFVATSHVRAGESVKEGQLLATLDAQDLNLAVNKWRSEQLKNQQAVDLALATRDRVALGRLRADTTRIAAEQALVERQLARAELRAPFDGVVLSGDFSQRLGSAVTQGDTLFTVAASNEYRLVLDIQEHDVGLVSPGQQADVRMSALPNQTWTANVDSVLPVASTSASANVFRVPAKLSERSGDLLPGMEGVAKIHAGSRSLAWVYTRTLREKLKVLAWRLGVIR